MLQLNPEIPNNFLVLERRESFLDYYEAYGDQIAEHYEREGIIVFPYFPIKFDVDLMQGLASPPESHKKMGVTNGIEAPVVVRDGNRLSVNEKHPFVQIWQEPMLAIYAHSQVVAADAQIREGMRILFPRYFTLREGNTTWRLTTSENEGLHFDVFHKGKPITPESKRAHRVKLFVNIDNQPRVWRTSLTLRGVLKRFAKRLPPVMPDDINIVNDILWHSGVLQELPTHTVSFPPMSAVLADGAVISHEVAFGRKLIASEYFCHYKNMLHPELAPLNSLAPWLRDAGIEVSITPDPRSAVEWLKDAGIVPVEQRAYA